MNTQDKAVSDYLKSIGVHYEARHIGKQIRSEWNDQQVNVYNLAFNFQNRDNRNQEILFSFYQGLGLKESPTAASALYGLLGDMELEGMSVQSYLDEFEGGHWLDLTVKRKREIEDMIESCRNNASKIRTIFTSEQRKYLRKLLEDY